MNKIVGYLLSASIIIGATSIILFAMNLPKPATIALLVDSIIVLPLGLILIARGKS